MITNTPSLLVDDKPGSGCDYHRIILPFQGKTWSPREDVLIFNRVFSRGVQEVWKLKQLGYKIIVDLDDYYDLNSEHYLKTVFVHHSENIQSMLKLADVVTVTTEFLAYKIRHLNRNIVVIRNALPYDEGQFTLSNDKDSGTPVIWAGGASHKHDLQLLENTFHSSKISIAGYQYFAKGTQNIVERLTNEQWTSIMGYLPHAKYVSAVKDLDTYMKVYDGHRVAVAPLVNNEFNRCKSNLKILEAGAKGLPIVCSRTLPYYNPVDDRVVVYAENKDQWYREVTKFIVNPRYAEDKGAALAEHVRLHYSLEDANRLRKQVLESL